ncbi:hypothetical protein MBM_09333 [Drepanopeziza brunnea f. sp. 'multigermtubi' MB_m1]|uniref:Uncharacterized protein n=1 Tax=Marssonina brunnea f. sp. multigermtubi (strain MB_m1) TaxID=1072389 RepID=K1WJR5_MARBU|nr:uncharacterized protein MBM_09333 [Drepanopeziza brunnea f. sp. 'multigermtubi' MB_m1]EKD12467.1 hypothetical protein MBM_09333 [Drepanopeziza brunnea f. sp. 'multigermtubi' MB_m1]
MEDIESMRQELPERIHAKDRKDGNTLHPPSPTPLSFQGRLPVTRGLGARSRREDPSDTEDLQGSTPTLSWVFILYILIRSHNQIKAYQAKLRREDIKNPYHLVQSLPESMPRRPNTTRSPSPCHPPQITRYALPFRNSANDIQNIDAVLLHLNPYTSSRAAPARTQSRDSQPAQILPFHLTTYYTYRYKGPPLIPFVVACSAPKTPGHPEASPSTSTSPYPPSFPLHLLTQHRRGGGPPPPPQTDRQTDSQEPAADPVFSSSD